MASIDTLPTDAGPRPLGERVVQTLDAIVLRDGPPSAERLGGALTALRDALVSRDLVILVETHGLMVNGEEIDVPSAIRLLHRLAGARIRRVRIQTTARDEDLSAMLCAVQGSDADAILARLRAACVTGVSIELRDRPMLPAMALPPSPEADDTAIVAVASSFAVALDPERGIAAAAMHWDVPVDPDLEADDREKQQAIAADTFASLLAARTSEERQQLFGTLVTLGNCVPFLQTMLSNERPHAVVTALALLRVKEAKETSGAIAELMRHPDRAVRLGAVRALGAFRTPICWNALQLGLFDREMEIRLASLQAFDAKEEPLPAPVMRTLLARETMEEMIVQIVERMSRYKSHEVVRALARAAVLQIKERGSIRILRALLEQLAVLQPPVARRLAHYLRGSPNPMRASLGDEIYRRTLGSAGRETSFMAAQSASGMTDDGLDDIESSELGLARLS